MIHPHPTLSEAFSEAEAASGAMVHLPPLRKGKEARP